MPGAERITSSVGADVVGELLARRAPSGVEEQHHPVIAGRRADHFGRARSSAIQDTLFDCVHVHTGSMKIEILHIEECPNWRDAGERVARVLEELDATHVPITFTLISTPEEAAAVPFAGSPTIVIDGVDAFPSKGATAELACRVYQADGRLAGTPSHSDLRTVLSERLATPEG